MRFIRKKEIKFVKLVLISPLFDQGIHIIYLISIIILFIKFLFVSDNISNFHISEQISDTLKENEFRNIKNIEEYKTYLNTTIYNLYDMRKFPLFIPIGAFRLKKYSLIDDCYSISENCKSTRSSSCAIEYLTKSFNNRTQICSLMYNTQIKTNKIEISATKYQQTLYDNFVQSLKGKYAYYDLLSDGISFDFTIDEYNHNPNEILSKLNDKNLRFAMLLFNVYSTYTGITTNVIIGLEMLNDYSNSVPFFTSTNFYWFKNEDVLIYLGYILFTTSVALSVLKLIYDINLKFQIVIHLCCVIHEIINLLLIIFITLYLSNSKITEINAYSKDFMNGCFSLINLRNLVNLLMTIAIFCLPFKFLSLLSWYNFTNHFIIYLNIMFKMIPGFILIILTFGGIIMTYSLMFFLIFNDTLKEFSQLYYSIFNILNLFDILQKYYYSSKISQNLLISKNYFFYNFVINICLFMLIGLSLATLIYMFREAVSIEIKNEDNELIYRLDGLGESLEKLAVKKRENSINISFTLKQIIWLCLTGSSEVYNDKIYNNSAKNNGNTDDNKFLIFNHAKQIISFFKYLFAIKPKMQFKKLENKFAILIECKNDMINKNLIHQQDLEQIYILFDWLNFAGCRIPLAVYVKADNIHMDSNYMIERNLRMNMKNNYGQLRFICHDEELNAYLNINKEYKENISTKNSPFRSLKKSKSLDSISETQSEDFQISLKKISMNSPKKHYDEDQVHDIIISSAESSMNTTEN